MPRTLLQAHELVKLYGSHAVLDGASVTLTERQKVGVIGRNGAGKSTLCRILVGKEAPESGRITPSPDLRLAYLEQHDDVQPGETALEYLMRRTGAPDWRCGQVAGRLQLVEELEQPAAELSGGYRTRLQLAAVLVAEPNLLVLDEPTNFLDLSTLLLLQDFLEDWSGGLLMVSHDREFLRRTCDHTLEVENGEATLYPGPVGEYLAYKREVVEQARRTNESALAKRAQLQRFIDRFGAKNTKATQAKSKAKQIERIEVVELPDELATVRISLPRIPPPRGVAFVTESLAIGYPDHTVADGIDLAIDQGAKVAIVGDNGQGKTTLLRTLAGELPPLEGRVRTGHAVEVAYYAQHVYESLDERDTVIAQLERAAAPDVGRRQILATAGSFLFKDEELEKPLGVLSGGERARVCLASLLLGGRGVLLLDEPTNHLDFETVEALARALRRYNGTVVCVSHDRTFVKLLATEVVEVRDGRVWRVPGDYDTYVHQLRLRLDERGGEQRQAAGGADTKSAGARAYEEQKRRRSEARRLRRELERVEERVHQLESRRDELNALVASAPDQVDYAELGRVSDDLHAAEARWMELADELETVSDD